MQIRFLVGALGFALLLIGGAAYWLDGESAETEVVSIENSDSATDAQKAPTEALVEELPSDEVESDVQDQQFDPADELSVDAVATGDFSPQERAALPALHESDDFVRTILESWELPAVWLAREGLMQRAATLLANLSQGTLPRRQLAFIAPAQKFGVRRVTEDEYELVTAGYARFDGIVDTVSRIPAEDMADVVVDLEALLLESLTQLGERTQLQTILTTIVSRIDATPEITAPIYLRRENVLYTFADPELEALPELNKQMLRMGPNNVRRIKIYAREFLRAYRARAS